ncbi:MAG TPA: NAD(P)H-binding protein [Solirubrobacteraceae bacterium]|nr:NAD(P)H-binding protein [Solirubrobacteraceae bacterium]
MVIAIAGAHGQIARRLSRLLAGRGDTVIGLIRNPDQADDVRQDGASPVVCDLEAATVDEVAGAIRGADAAVFAAGAGPGSGAERKLTMDRDGAVKFLRAATSAEVARFLIVSSVGAENPPDGDDVYSVYQRAKGEADRAVQASDGAWTIIRPGRLTDDPGTGHVRIATDPFRGEVPRDDVAAVIARVLEDDRFSRRVLYVNSGEESIEDALNRALTNA